MHPGTDNQRNKISVIIPIYNGGEWLHDALKSLQTQTYRDFEAIMVNDGSTDNSKEICMEFVSSDPRFHLINQDNQGVSTARNNGLDLAQGEWIAFMDADDIMPQDALETLIELAMESGAGIVAGEYLRGLYAAGNAMNLFPTETTSITSEEAIRLGLYQKRILNTPCGMLFHSSVFNGEKHLRFRKCRYEDLDLFYQAFERVDKVCLTNQTVYFYRDNPGSFINTWSDARLDVLDVTDRIVEHMAGKSPELYRAALDRRFSAHFNMLVEMERHNINNIEQKKRCLKIIREQRLNELRDPEVRMKNKLGALVSFLGMPAIRLICKF